MIRIVLLFFVSEHKEGAVEGMNKIRDQISVRCSHFLFFKDLRRVCSTTVKDIGAHFFI